jgi:regulatory protein
MVQHRRHKTRLPLDAAGLDALALGYVGRYATTRKKLVDYLVRKLRERGVADDTSVDPHAIADRMVARGYVNDEGYARSKSENLLTRGYGAMRVRSALGQAGIARDIADAVITDDIDTAVAAATAYARRRRLGRFAATPVDVAQMRKHMAAMLRAGHDFAISRSVLQPEQP